jgi:hypothetical protein
MPAAVAARPRDARGYPVPAITPWEDGQPQFARTGVARTFLCAAERRCSICATEMAPGPVWRVVGGEEVDAIEAALRDGRPYRNRAPTAEAPGHRACMLYAAIVCPWLGRPNARRGQAAVVPGLAVDRGDARGASGAVVGFEAYEFEYSELVLFRFAGLMEFRRYETGVDQLPELAAAIADETAMPPATPDYLGRDEAAAQRAFEAYVERLLGPQLQ